MSGLELWAWAHEHTGGKESRSLGVWLSAETRSRIPTAKGREPGGGCQGEEKEYGGETGRKTRMVFQQESQQKQLFLKGGKGQGHEIP